MEGGFASEELILAGVAIGTRSGGIIDRFHDRIMVAQHNNEGHIVGFISRAAPGARVVAPKYLSNPRSDIYNKRALLFGLYQNRAALADGYRPVLVEGPLDVLAIAAAEGGGERPLAAVAACGTALTREQVGLLAYHARREAGVVVAYDNDQAGRSATASTYELLREGMDVPDHVLQAATLPRGTDPAELLQIHGPGALSASLTDRQLRRLSELAIDIRLEPWAPVLDGADGRIGAVKDVAHLIAHLPPADVAQQIARVAERVHLDPVTVTIAVTDTLTSRPLGRHMHRGRAVRAACTHSRPPNRLHRKALTGGYDWLRTAGDA